MNVMQFVLGKKDCSRCRSKGVPRGGACKFITLPENGGLGLKTVPKRRCPRCLTGQTFDEYSRGVRRCQSCANPPRYEVPTVRL